jgi:hypothetical protein
MTFAACSGAPASFVPDSETTDEDTTETVTDDAVPTDIANDLEAYSYQDGTLTITGLTLDSTPETVTYTRTESLDVEGFEAYSIQEDALDRMFIGLAAQSSDGVVSAVVAGDGGQFNRVFNGALYTRSGDFDAPEIGTGPAAGQVSYAGRYAGLWNGGVSAGDTTSVLLPVPVPEDADLSLYPNQAARIEGQVFLNANFQNDSVNGSIYDRSIVDTGLALPTIVLVPTDIAEDGTFEGGTEWEDETGVGSYAGVFGGDNAQWVAGGISLTNVTPDIEGELERGVFILEQCNTSTAGVCDNVAQ